MLNFIQDSSNQRKIAVALCAFLALFSQKLPFLADVNQEMLVTLIGAIAVWIGQSGAKAAVEAHAEGQVHAAMIQNADDAVAVFNHIVANGSTPIPPTVKP